MSECRFVYKTITDFKKNKKYNYHYGIFNGIDFYKQKILRTPFINVMFDNCNFSPSYIYKCVFYKCYFVDCDFENCEFDECLFIDCKIEQSNIEKVSHSPIIRNGITYLKLGDYLKRYRFKEHLTDTDMAEKINLPLSLYRRIEKNDFNCISIQTIKDISNIIGISYMDTMTMAFDNYFSDSINTLIKVGECM